MFGNEGTSLFLGIFTNISKFSDPFIKWGINRKGWCKGVGMIRYGLDYGMYLPIGVVFYDIDDFAYKVICC